MEGVVLGLIVEGEISNSIGGVWGIQCSLVGVHVVEINSRRLEPVCKCSQVRKLDCKCCEPVSAVRELLGSPMLQNM